MFGLLHSWPRLDSTCGYVGFRTQSLRFLLLGHGFPVRFSPECFYWAVCSQTKLGTKTQTHNYIYTISKESGPDNLRGSYYNHLHPILTCLRCLEKTNYFYFSLLKCLLEDLPMSFSLGPGILFIFPDRFWIFIHEAWHLSPPSLRCACIIVESVHCSSFGRQPFCL